MIRLPRGKSQLVVDFVYDGGGMGKGGTITMTAMTARRSPVDASLERFLIRSPLVEGLDVGMDVGSPIDFTPTSFSSRSPEESTKSTSNLPERQAGIKAA